MSNPGLRLVDAYVGGLRETLHNTLADMAAEMPLLAANAAARLPRYDDIGTARERLFAVVVAAAMGAKPAQALPVATASALWWTGVTGELAGATMLALHHIGTVRAPRDRKLRWMEDISQSTTSAAEASLAATARRCDDLSRHDVLSDHLGVFGAAYARDAVMTARVCAPHAIEDWRRFGLMYGLLRGLTLDRRKSTGDSGVPDQLVAPDLLLAHASAIATAGARLRDLVHASHVVAAYHADLRGLHRRAHELLDKLEPAPVFGDVLRSALDEILEAPRLLRHG